jgi:hypothetical protein
MSQKSGVLIFATKRTGTVKHRPSTVFDCLMQKKVTLDANLGAFVPGGFGTIAASNPI